MTQPLAEGRIKFQITYLLPTPPNPELISCRVDGAHLFPVFLNHREVLVFGYFTTAVCYSYRSDGGSRDYHVATQTHNLAEVIPLRWAQEVPADCPAASFRLEVTTPTSWQCWAEPRVPEIKEKGRRLPLLASLFSHRPRNLAVFVASVIAVQLFPRREELPAEPPREREKTPSPPATQGEKQKPAPPPAVPKPAPAPKRGEATGEKWEGQKKNTAVAPGRRAGRPTLLTGKKIILPAAFIPTTSTEVTDTRGSRNGSLSTASIPGRPWPYPTKTLPLSPVQEEGTGTAPAAAPIKTWSNLAKLAPPPKPPGG